MAVATGEDPVGNLYAHYMTIDNAPAETKTEHRDKYAYILSTVHMKDNLGARKLSADFIGSLFKFFPDETERSVQALASLCVDSEPSIRKKAAETLVEICRATPSYVKRVADLLIQMYGLADQTEAKGLQQCLVKLLQLEPRQALEGLLDQVTTAEDVIRQPAIKFLRTKLGEIPPAASNSELATFLIGEYRKILPDATPEEFENLVESLSGMKFFQTLNGSQLLVDMLTDLVVAGPTYRLKTPDQAERTITCCRLALPAFSRMIHSTKLVEYFCDHVIPSVALENPDADLPALQVFAELCISSEDQKSYSGPMRVILHKLLDVLPQAPTEAGVVIDEDSLLKLRLSAIECLLGALHSLGKRYAQFFTEPEQVESFKDLRQRLQYLNSCMQLYIQKMATGKLKPADAEATKKADSVRRVIANIKALVLDLYHNPPQCKTAVHHSWKKEGAPASDRVQHPRIEGKVATKRKADVAEESNGASGKVSTKYSSGASRTAAASARLASKTTAVKGTSSTADQAKLDARAKRFGGENTAAASDANEGTKRFAKSIRKPISFN